MERAAVVHWLKLRAASSDLDALHDGVNSPNTAPWEGLALGMLKPQPEARPSVRQVQHTAAVLVAAGTSTRPSSSRRLSSGIISLPDSTAVIAELATLQQRASAREVPWFLANMPQSYFRHVSAPLRSKHLQAITAVCSDGVQVPDVMLKDGGEFTFLSSETKQMGRTKTAAVARELDSLPSGTDLQSVRLFSSKDGRLGLHLFSTVAEQEAEPRFAAATPEERAAEQVMHGYLSELLAGSFTSEAAGRHTPPESSLTNRSAKASLDAFLRRCPSSYVTSHKPRLLLKQRHLCESIAGTDDVAVDIERLPASFALGEDESTLLTLATHGMSARAALRRILALLDVHGLNLYRAAVTIIDDRPSDGACADAGTSIAPGSISLLEAEVAVGLADLALAVVDHPIFTRPYVYETLLRPRVLPHANELARLFIRRFDPTDIFASAALDTALLAASEAREKSLEDESTRMLLRAMESAVRHTLRANVHRDARWALALRLDPKFFAPKLPPAPSSVSNLPFGVFFCAGRSFNGYHTRFADIARGGLRVVLPPSAEAHMAESSRHFKECFDLAWAQHLKNKDIPEGGSKAVCLATPSVDGEERSKLLHRCVKTFTDSLLDVLVVPHPTPAQPELLYLGPDENITPFDINWIVARAKKRGYSMAPAFMSSKPREGINHKVYGVTSEGVAVFLEHALRAIGIRPDAEPWSIKLTGGPDGDVAGNMLKVLARDYGDYVRVVGMADGSGCAEDPDGLPMADLLRLFHAGLPLSEMRTELLGPRGSLTLANTPEGAALRNTLHNRVQADIFVPAGGRPAAINGANWKQYLLPDGSPSSRAIVEGANLFLTPEARAGLFGATGLPIVKDSSANKCGVICSSMEIVASMTLSADEFVDIKEQYVHDVLCRLRELAGQEASLLFAESARDPTVPHVKISEQISFACLRVATALAALLDRFDQSANKDRLWPLVREQLPPVLFEKYAARLPERIPWEYQKSMIANGLASRLVYREGLTFVNSVPDSALPSFALAYLQQEQRVRALAAEVAKSGHDFAPEVSRLLLQGGVRAAAEEAATRKAARA
ncbi:glu leu phe val dehydrogenase [Chrysochromulina tobinii]|uniref:Glu leu phe val dehydrogenase n=1 Tax=Chrysochromulina tobinii TaxID=1460289 RepID=A0A0M0K7Q0_9EUKA|nr:glu leu phe val dehydrogenase [Chrysochromulina tobinii]|eukprot:KOO34829.1 glu leu phe val dehydrogenase [Chrysochromulina sp. CCMP291]